MECDLYLIKNFESLGKIPILRFYRWKPFCISIGYNQSDEFLNYEICRNENVEIVRRPTGGRAIYHCNEATYSIIMESNESISLTYNKISFVILEAIKNFGIDVHHSNGSSLTREIYSNKNSFSCFSTFTKNEIKFQNKKLVGSAQHRFGNILLQQGSIMIGDEFKYLPKFCKDFSIENLNYLNEHTISINSILNKDISYENIRDEIKKSFEKNWNANFIPLDSYIENNFLK